MFGIEINVGNVFNQSCFHPNFFLEREPEHQRADDHLAAGSEGWNVGQHSIANRHLPGTVNPQFKV